MPDLATGIEVIDGRRLPGRGGPAATKLAGMRDLGAVRRVDHTRLRAFEIDRPLVFLTSVGEKSAVAGDVMLVAPDELYPVRRDAFERWYEPASEHDDGASGSADIVGAIRLALAAADTDAAAIAVIGQLLSYGPPTEGSRNEPAQLLIRAVRESAVLR